MKKSMMLCALVAVSAFAEEPNLLLNAKATASSIQSPKHAAAYAVDGKMNTRWASQSSNNEILTLDMGAVKTIGRVVINWEVAGGKEYKLQLSTDNKNWVDAAVVNDGKSAEKRTLTFKPQQARYVRVNAMKRATVYAFSIWEISAFAK